MTLKNALVFTDLWPDWIGIECENGKIEIDVLNTNTNHTIFKEPFPKYEKGENSQPKNGKATINYTFNRK